MMSHYFNLFALSAFVGAGFAMGCSVVIALFIIMVEGKK